MRKMILAATAVVGAFAAGQYRGEQRLRELAAQRRIITEDSLGWDCHTMGNRRCSRQQLALESEECRVVGDAIAWLVVNGAEIPEVLERRSESLGGCY